MASDFTWHTRVYLYCICIFIVQSKINLLTRSLTCSLAASLPPPYLPRSLPPSLPPSLTHSRTHSLTHSLNHYLVKQELYYNSKRLSKKSKNFNFSRMLSWKRAVVTEEDLMQSAIIRDFIDLRDSDASENDIEDIYWIMYVQSDHVNYPPRKPRGFPGGI